MIPLFKVAMSPYALTRVGATLMSGFIGQGPRVDDFENALRSHFGVPHVLTTNSCTSALDLALHLCGVGPGDPVITTPLTCTATNGVVVRRGAIPVWADVDSHGLISSESVAARFKTGFIHAYTHRPCFPKAIIGVDWGGRLADYAALKQFGTKVIQDAAHCFSPASAQTAADFTCYSFQAIKFLTTGDGGALLCKNENDHKRGKLLRWYGLDRESSSDFRCEQNIFEIGYKYHMNDIAASIGLANLDLALSNLRTHQRNAALLGATEPGDYWVYFIRTPMRRQFREFMASRDITTSLVHRRNDLHDGFSLSNTLYGPLSEHSNLFRYDQEYVAIPCGWWLSDSDLQHIKDALHAWTQASGTPATSAGLGS